MLPSIADARSKSSLPTPHPSPPTSSSSPSSSPASDDEEEAQAAKDLRHLPPPLMGTGEGGRPREQRVGRQWHGGRGRRGGEQRREESRALLLVEMGGETTADVRSSIAAAGDGRESRTLELVPMWRQASRGMECAE